MDVAEQIERIAAIPGVPYTTLALVVLILCIVFLWTFARSSRNKSDLEKFRLQLRQIETTAIISERKSSDEALQAAHKQQIEWQSIITRQTLALEERNRLDLKRENHEAQRHTEVNTLNQNIVLLLKQQNQALERLEQRNSETALLMVKVDKGIEDTNHGLTDTTDTKTLAHRAQEIEGIVRDILARADTLQITDVPGLKALMVQEFDKMYTLLKQVQDEVHEALKTKSEPPTQETKDDG